MVIRAGRLLAVCGALAAAGACDWRAFDDLADTTWVDTAGAPSGTNTKTYAVGVTAVGGVTDGVTLLAAGDENASVGLLAYDSTGGLNTDGARVQADLGSVTAINIGVTPAPFAAAPDGTGSFAIGMPDHEITDGNNNGQVVLALATGGALAPRKPLQDARTVELGRALAYGFSAGGSAADLFAVGVKQLVLFEDPSDSSTLHICTIAREKAYAVHAVDLVTGDGSDELLITGGDLTLLSGAPPEVNIVSAQTIIDASAAAMDNQLEPCFDDGRMPVATLTPPNGESDFGLTITSGDFNGNDTMDVAIAAPGSNAVYVWLDPDPTGAIAAPVQLTTPPGSVAFGTAMAAGDVDLDGNDELLVGDPHATVEGVENAGQAHLFTFSGTGFGTPWTIHDVDPEGDQEFGRSVVIAPFMRNSALAGGVVSVAAQDEVFTYFRVPGTEDLRQ